MPGNTTRGVFAIGIGETIGQIVAAIATFDFSSFNLADSFDLGGDFLGLFSKDVALKVLPESIAKIVFMAGCSLIKITSINFVPSQRRPRRGDYNIFASEHLAFIVS